MYRIRWMREGKSTWAAVRKHYRPHGLNNRNLLLLNNRLTKTQYNRKKHGTW